MKFPPSAPVSRRTRAGKATCSFASVLTISGVSLSVLVFAGVSYIVLFRSQLKDIYNSLSITDFASLCVRYD